MTGDCDKALAEEVFVGVVGIGVSDDELAGQFEGGGSGNALLRVLLGM